MLLKASTFVALSSSPILFLLVPLWAINSKISSPSGWPWTHSQWRYQKWWNVQKAGSKNEREWEERENSSVSRIWIICPKSTTSLWAEQLKIAFSLFCFTVLLKSRRGRGLGRNWRQQQTQYRTSEVCSQHEKRDPLSPSHPPSAAHPLLGTSHILGARTPAASAFWACMLIHDGEEGSTVRLACGKEGSTEVTFSVLQKWSAGCGWLYQSSEWHQPGQIPPRWDHQLAEECRGKSGSWSWVWAAASL